MEASALTHSAAAPALRGPTPLLRLQSDERLIALTRRGQHAAFEVLCARYQSRLLSFCRHMLGSREDAEDVLQEVFTAAFNAVLADEREINVRPWLYRIARNRSLNHLRRASAVGVDSMDVHFADHGMSTGDRAIRRESFRELLSDVHELPETQRTALLLREIDALSYEQIAHAMETTVPSVKSLLVRARISLAEAAEARKLSCDEVRFELGEVAESLVKLSAPARRHVRGCERCRSFKKQLTANNTALAAILPVGPLLIFKKLLAAKLGLAKLGSAGSAQLAGGASAGVGAGAAAGAAGGAGAGGIFTVGAGALATKAVAGLAAAAIVGAGAVAADQSGHRRRHAHSAATAAVAAPAAEPHVVAERTQPAVAVIPRRTDAALLAARRHRAARRAALAAATPDSATAKPPAPAPAAAAKPPAPTGAAEPQVTEVTSESTQLPSSATADGQPAGAVPTPVTTTTTPSTTPTAVPAPTTPVTTTTTTTPSDGPPTGAGTTIETTPQTQTPPPAGEPGADGTTGGAPASGTGETQTASPAPAVVPQTQPAPPQQSDTGASAVVATHRTTRPLGRHWGAKRP